MLERARAKARHFQERPARPERPVGIAMRHDGVRKPRPKARYMGQKRRRRSVQIDAHGVHRILDHRLKRLRKAILVHIVLVLADPDGLRFDLHQLRQRILEAPGDRYGATQ